MGYGKVHNKDQKAARKDAFIKLGLGLVALLLIVDTIQISRFGAIVERVDEYNKGVVDEIGGFRQDISLMGNDMNEMRKFLLMPTREYSFMETSQIEQSEEGQELSSTEKAAYNFLTGYISEIHIAENTQQAQARINALLVDAALQSKVAELGLSTDNISENNDAYLFKISDADNGALAAILSTKATNKLSAQSILGTQELETDNDSAAVQNYIEKNKDTIIQAKKSVDEKTQQLIAAMNNEQIKSALSEKSVTFNQEPVDDGDSLTFNVQNKDGVSIIGITLSKQNGTFVTGEDQLDASKDLAEQLLPLVQNIDTATESEKMIAERRAELEKVFAEPAFADMLQTAGLTVASEPREDYNKLIYDVTDKNGYVHFSFVIEVSSGLYKVLKDNQETDFFTLLQDDSKKKL